MMVSFGDMVPASDSGTLKFQPIGSRWGALYAGDDISPALPIIDRARSKLQSNASGDSFGEVLRIVREAYQEERAQQVSDRFLSIIGLNFKEFKAEGYQQLGPAEYGKLLAEIKNFTLGVELLVHGLDKESSRHHIFTVDDPGAASQKDLMGYWAIGSGQYMALGALAGRSLSIMSVPELIYRLCAAKFAAGTATGVGKATLVTVMDKDGNERMFTSPMVDELKAVWEEEQRNPTPTKAFNIIAKAFETNS
jgi:hypothetical protein